MWAPNPPPAPTNAVPEEAVFNQLSQAASIIDNALSREDRASVELWDLLTGQVSVENYIGVGDFERKRLVPLPQALLQQYNEVNCTCFMGLLPEIRRAWITIDNKLFLWNYEDGSDFYVYDVLDQLIISVGLVRPRPGVFQEAVKYLLVVTTPVEVVLLAVSNSPDTSGQLALLPTQLTVSSDNVNLLKIIGTNEGRIFLSGKDGCLYELIYQANEGWWGGRKVRKVNHSASPLTSLVPSFLRVGLGSEDAIVDICFDATRNWLYTLSASSAVTLYDLDEDGRGFRRVITKTGLAREAGMLCPRSSSWPDSVFQVIAIHPVSDRESAAVHLVAITISAIRLYFSCYPQMTASMAAHSGGGVKERPSTLQLIHVRLPPPRPASISAAQQQLQQANAGLRLDLSSNEYFRNVHATHYARGVALMADGAEEVSDVVLGTSLDTATQQAAARTIYDSYQRPPAAAERATVMQVEGKTWAVGEISSPPVALLQLSNAHVHKVDIATKNELVYQHLQGPRQYLALTNQGAYVLLKRRPLDDLYDLLQASGGAASPALNDFFTQYGDEQACAMCLVLACHPHLAFSNRDRLVLPPSGVNSTGGVAAANGGASLAPPNMLPFTESSVAQWATLAFFRHGGRPTFALPKPAPAMLGQVGGVDLGRPAGAVGSEISYSAAHQALALHVSRLLRPLWAYPIAGRAFPLPTTTQYRQALELLIPLQDFLVKQHQAFTYNLNYAETTPTAAGGGSQLRTRLLEMQRTKQTDEAAKLEARAMAALHAVLRRSIEALQFLLLCNEYGFAEMLRKLPQELLARLDNLRFRDLVASTPEGAELSKILVANLISMNEGAAQLRETLAAKCPSFFNEWDHRRFEAEELLNRAQRTSYRDALDLLAQSCSLLTKIPLSIPKVAEICTDYRFYRFHVGVVALAESTANFIDPSNLALNVAEELQPQQQQQTTGQVVQAQQPQQLTSPGGFALQTPAAGQSTQTSGALNEAVLQKARQKFDERQRAYELINPSLDELCLPPSALPPPSQVPGVSNYPRPRPEPLDDMDRQRAVLFTRILSSNDPLLHFHLYRWLLAHQQQRHLLDINSDFLETFLRAHEELELLWQLYVRQEKFAAAAQVLAFVACAPKAQLSARLLQSLPAPHRLDLETRLSYLSRAITNAKSAGGVGITAEAVDELEEKMEVARIQRQVLVALHRLQPAGLSQQLLVELDEELMDISSLYRHARRFQLLEACLAILHCSGHNDPQLVRKMWDEIISFELARGDAPQFRLDALRTKLIEQGRLYYPSELVFPLVYLIDVLERKSMELRGSADYVVRLMHEGVGIAYSALFEHYVQLVDVADSEARKFHLLRSLRALIEGWATFIFRSGRATPQDRRSFDLKRGAVENAIDKALEFLNTTQERQLTLDFKKTQQQTLRG